MSSDSQRRATRAKVLAHRAWLREEGLRPVQIWVPETHSAAFAAEDQAFVDAIAEPWGA